MGLFKVFGKFTFCLYFLFLDFIVLINLCNFAGISTYSVGSYYQIVIDYTNGNNFQNSYFGFTSVLNAFADFPDSMFINGMTKTWYNLLNGYSAGAFSFGMLQAGDSVFRLAQILLLIADILLAPIKVLEASLEFLIYFIGFAITVAGWIARIFGGYYNIPIVTA